MPYDITGFTGSQLIGFARNQQKKRWPVAYPLYTYPMLTGLPPRVHARELESRLIAKITRLLFLKYMYIVYHRMDFNKYFINGYP